MIELKILACVLLACFLSIACIDGLYLHLFKFKLYAREESKKEHLLHTLNTCLFPWTIYFVFLTEFKGLFLWFGVLLTVASYIIEFVDVFEEDKSRKWMGGLPNYEYALHFATGLLRASYTTLILASKPVADWSLSSESFTAESDPMFLQYFINPIMVTSLFIACVHVGLILYTRYSIPNIIQD